MAAGTVDAANQPPVIPTINEPATDGQVVNPFDVHMVTAPFADPDPGDTQGCTDWQIVLASTLQPVWLKTCARNVSAFHIHLGDGAFQLPFTELTSDTDYLLRVRHSDNLGAFSPWSQRAFRTAAPPPPGSPDHKWVLPQPDYEVQLVATGFQLPVSIAFVPNPGSQPNDPFYYVAELYGTIKVVTRSGVVSDYATNLLNFEPTGVFPGTGEQGIGGILVEPATGDLFVSLLYSSDPADYYAPLYPRVIRLHSHSSGLIADGETTVLDMVGETMLSSHIASNLTIGPDGKLYVHVGDGFFDGMGLDLDSFRGKILRMNLDGSAPPDNPFYGQSTGTDAKAYIYAYGFRNPFGGAWRDADGMHYEVEPGPSVDRFAQVVAGRNYGFDTTNASMETFALWNWFESVAPVNVTFIQPSTFAGSGFPAEKMDHAFVAESGPTYATGPVVNGKRITEFVLHPDGTWLSGPTPFVEYGGVGKATVIALTPGPDGLYFSDFYKDTDYLSPTDRGSNILRVTFLGTIDFRADVNAGSAPPDGPVYRRFQRAYPDRLALEVRGRHDQLHPAPGPHVHDTGGLRCPPDGHERRRQSVDPEAGLHRRGPGGTAG